MQFSWNVAGNIIHKVITTWLPFYNVFAQRSWIVADDSSRRYHTQNLHAPLLG